MGSGRDFSDPTNLSDASVPGRESSSGAVAWAESETRGEARGRAIDGGLVSRSYDSIEGDIAKARDDLATTLDELADRVNPKNLATEGKEKATAVLKDPRVLAVIGGVAALVIGGIAFSAANKRKERQRIEAYLEARRG
nr:DUF3618 domain-containing protein [Dietzia aerolata]